MAALLVVSSCGSSVHWSRETYSPPVVAEVKPDDEAATQVAGEAQPSQAESGAQPRFVPTSALPAPYRIGRNDKLEISVFDDPDLNTTQNVRPDGIIVLLLD